RGFAARSGSVRGFGRAAARESDRGAEGGAGEQKRERPGATFASPRHVHGSSHWRAPTAQRIKEVRDRASRVPDCARGGGDTQATAHAKFTLLSRAFRVIKPRDPHHTWPGEAGRRGADQTAVPPSVCGGRPFRKLEAGPDSGQVLGMTSLMRAPPC